MRARSVKWVTRRGRGGRTSILSFAFPSEESTPSITPLTCWTPRSSARKASSRDGSVSVAGASKARDRCMCSSWSAISTARGGMLMPVVMYLEVSL